MGSAPFGDCTLLDALLEVDAVHDALDEDPGRMDVVGIDLAGSTRRSTSATVTRAAVAMTGLKLRAALR